MIRLDKLLSSLGLGSRAQVKQMIRAGRVSAGGITVISGDMKVSQEEIIAVDGEALDTRTQRHLMMNKPAGVLTAARDARQPTVMDLLAPVYRSLECMPVGRLDKDTEGLLLFTTNGQAAHRLLAPQEQVHKRYLARVTGRLTQSVMKRFEEGIELDDFRALPATLIILDAQVESSLAEAIVCEGKFHQVKRMFAACGHEVTALTRLQFGPLMLDEALAPGEYRELNADEWRQLLEAAGYDS